MSEENPQGRQIVISQLPGREEDGEGYEQICASRIRGQGGPLPGPRQLHGFSTVGTEKGLSSRPNLMVTWLVGTTLGGENSEREKVQKQSHQDWKANLPPCERPSTRSLTCPVGRAFRRGDSACLHLEEDSTLFS